MLRRAFESDRLASAYLFRGPAGTGKFAAALELARLAKCDSPADCEGNCRSCRLMKKLDHPDLHVILPLPKNVSSSPEKTAEVLSYVSEEPFAKLSFEKPASVGIDDIRALTQKLALTPSKAGGRWAIVRDADLMTSEASNCFLKTLEEPPEDSYIILTCSRPDFLLPTIRSRTQPVSFVRLSRPRIAEFLKERGIEPEKAAKIAIVSDGSITTALAQTEDTGPEVDELGEQLWVTLFSKSDKIALELVEKFGRDRSLAKSVISSATSFLRDQMLIQLGLGALVRNTDSKDRIETAARKFPDPRPLGEAIQFLQRKSNSLYYNPQYDLFWMDLILRARQIVLRS